MILRNYYSLINQRLMNCYNISDMPIEEEGIQATCVLRTMNNLVIGPDNSIGQMYNMFLSALSFVTPNARNISSGTIGILLSNEDDPVTFDTYNMGVLYCEDGTTLASLTTGSFSELRNLVYNAEENSVTVEKSISITSTSSQNFTIKSWGIFADGGSYREWYPMLFAKEVLSEPFTVEPNETIKFTIKYKYYLVNNAPQ